MSLQQNSACHTLMLDNVSNVSDRRSCYTSTGHSQAAHDHLHSLSYTLDGCPPIVSVQLAIMRSIVDSFSSAILMYSPFFA
jgi:hypothetical protein